MAWIKVANISDVKAGTGKTVHANGQELALFLVDEQYFCMENSCPHMDGPLADGDLEGDTVYCPWHFWPINVRTGAVTFDPAVCATTFPCKTEGDVILVQIG